MPTAPRCTHSVYILPHLAFDSIELSELRISSIHDSHHPITNSSTTSASIFAQISNNASTHHHCLNRHPQNILHLPTSRRHQIYSNYSKAPSSASSHQHDDHTSRPSRCSRHQERYACIYSRRLNLQLPLTRSILFKMEPTHHLQA
ncbi:hypothetical protein CC78DRAFT_244840 [Lojkania enalia]|uniref:Uncharacterized protein n=1 Tax=Lojkania enalia TaxID=147567 RepID=A0A9P4NB08_9PLEO|nr:hypothetical protein CC78DRAFT_244840 [Didymosphaeria enalia]